MPKFAANLSMLYTELPFLDRFKAAAEAGFTGVEYLFPYAFPKEQVVEKLQASGLIHLPYQLFLMLPFVLTILAMALVSRNARAPAALLIPFRREER